MTSERGVRGETIAEALVSILIAELVFTFLTRAVVTAARINATIKNEDVSVKLEGAEPEALTTPVSISGGGTLNGQVYVRIYKTKANSGGVSYRYYEFDSYSE